MAISNAFSSLFMFCPFEVTFSGNTRRPLRRSLGLEATKYIVLLINSFWVLDWGFLSRYWIHLMKYYTKSQNSLFELVFSSQHAHESEANSDSGCGIYADNIALLRRWYSCLQGRQEAKWAPEYNILIWAVHYGKMYNAIQTKGNKLNANTT